MPAWLSVAGGAAVLGGLTIAMMWWTWGKWPDAIVDFGRELYVPWRLSEGEVLYRDVAHFNGPLSQYVNSVWFRLFGVSLRTLALANLALFGVSVALVYALVARIASRAVAFVACILFVLLFGFAHFTLSGNYNYICPYSHEATHGLLLSLAAMYFLGRFARHRRAMDVALCGLSVGLAFLTKPEIFVAVLPSTLLGVALVLWDERPTPARIASRGGAFLAAMVVPPLAAFGLLSLAMPAGDALDGTLGGTRWLFNSTLTSQPFYQQSAGVLEPADNLRRMAFMGGWYVVFFAPPVVLGVALRGRMWLWSAAAAAADVGLLWFLHYRIPWADLLLPLPLATLGVACVAVYWWSQSDAADRPRLVLAVSFTLFGLLLLAKIILNARMYQYGFVLAVPATLMLLVFLVDWLPRWLDRRGRSGAPLRFAVLATLALITFWRGGHSSRNYAAKTVPVGSGGDAIWCDRQGRSMNLALGEIAGFPAEATFSVLPEGVMLNYLSRHTNPTKYLSLMPPEVIMFGEDRIIESFREHPPDFLIWTDEDTRGYGYERLGVGYGERLVDWLSKHCEVVKTGQGANTNLSFAVLKWRDEEAAEPSNPDERPHSADGDRAR
ncbi:MAG: glycosyltransferase family 39 protein [Planctomycetia bacterium]|nr:glycosyltransferase family 39 protein [Planctomycetia bacterium]